MTTSSQDIPAKDADGASAPPEAITVLVTGFGIFGPYKRNPSWEIARSLPATLDPTDSKSTRITLRGIPEPITNTHTAITALVPQLLAETATRPTPDIVVHIGVAPNRDYYTLERGAHRGGYGKKRGNDGKTFSDDESTALWPDMPDALTTGFNVEASVESWRARLRDSGASQAVRDADVRVSEDAGDFMCGFTYFNSLAWFRRRENAKQNGGSGGMAASPVVFVHVPALPEEKDIETAREILIALIHALVEAYEAESGHHPA